MDLVIVYWLDAHSVDGWHNAEELAKLEPMEVRSVGWVVGQTNDILKLVTTVSPWEGKIKDACMSLTIPKGMIKRVVSLTRGEEPGPDGNNARDT